jgi:hypothetical protein
MFKKINEVNFDCSELLQIQKTENFTLENMYFLYFGLFQTKFPDKFVKWILF